MSRDDHPELSQAQYDRVLDILARAHAAGTALPGSARQRSFVAETHARLERFGTRTYLSAKQLAWIDSIADALAEAGQAQDEDAVEPVDDFMRRRS